MATPPTFVAAYTSAFNTNATPRSVTFSAAAGDKLVVVAVTEDMSTTLATPTGGTGLTYTLKQSVVVSSYTTAYVWSVDVASANTSQSMSITATGGGQYGFIIYRFSGSTGFGGSNKTNIASGAPSLAVTATGDNSALVSISGDWAAVDGTSRTWRTINSITPTAGNGGEQGYYRDAVHYAQYSAYWSDCGVAGSKTVGVSAPSGQKYSIVALEVLGTASSNVNVNAADAANSHTTSDATVALTDSDGAAPSLSHTAGQPAPTLAVAAEAPAISHTAFDAVASVPSAVNVNAELTNHTFAAGDPAPALADTADVANHSQTASDATTAQALPGGAPALSHTSGDLSGGLGATDQTAPALAHTTSAVTSTQTTPAGDAATTHQALDPTVSTAVILNLNAPATDNQHITADAGVRVDVNAEAPTIAHSAFDAVASAGGAVPAGDAANTHTTSPALAGVGGASQNPSHSLVVSDVTSTQTTLAGAASVAHSAFDAFVTTSLAPPAFVDVDGGSTWVTPDSAESRVSLADSVTTISGLVG